MSDHYMRVQKQMWAQFMEEFNQLREKQKNHAGELAFVTSHLDEARKENENLKNDLLRYTTKYRELQERVRHCIDLLEGRIPTPGIDLIRKAHGLEPLNLEVKP